jgi:hypothetical protein
MSQVHVTPRLEAAMNFPRPDQTIGQLLAEFLAGQETRLSPKGYRQCVGIIALCESYLECYWPGHSREEYDVTDRPDGTFCGTFGAEDLIGGISEFLSDFLPHEIGADTETMRAAGAVIEQLTAWLAAKGHVERREDAREQMHRAARELPATQNLLELLQDWLAGASPADYIDDVEDHFLIHRIEPRRIWLESMMAGEVWGPIAVPVSIARACRVGWDIGGVVVHTTKGWRLIKVWNVSP